MTTFVHRSAQAEPEVSALPGLTWQEASKKLKKTLDHYEAREDQTALAEAIETVLVKNKPLMANAPTGVGKSLAAALPAIAHARKTGLPVIISTETKALQAQYITKELPWIKEHIYPDLQFVKLMGRGNYLCWQSAEANKHEEAVRAVAQEAEDRFEDPLFFGELESFKTKIDYKNLNLLTVSSGDCTSSKCPFYDKCLPNRAKKFAVKADVIIINHSLLVADAVLKAMDVPLLPEHSSLIIDEAHELENVATNALAETLNVRGLDQLCKDVDRFVDEEPAHDKVDELRAQCSSIFQHIDTLFREEQKEGSKFLKPVKLSDATMAESGLMEGLEEIFFTLISLADLIDLEKTSGTETAYFLKKKLKSRVVNMAQKLDVLLGGNEINYVRWIDGTAYTDPAGQQSIRLGLRYAPIMVNDFLKENLWSLEPTTVLMSATLAINNKFDFIADRIGLEGYTTFTAGTPFDYQNQAGLLLMRNIDPGKFHDWQQQCQFATSALVKAAGGRALLLFTSRSELEQAHRALAKQFRDHGLTVLKQSPDMKNGDLAQTFKDDETSVLFGLRSFMTGFSVEGDACRLVILNKLPFATPDDVIFTARTEDIDRKLGKWQGFNKLAIPNAILTLMQSFGRLIRTKRDKGVFVLMDSRVHEKNYGKRFRNALPDCSSLSNLDEACQMLQNLQS